MNKEFMLMHPDVINHPIWKRKDCVAVLFIHLFVWAIDEGKMELNFPGIQWCARKFNFPQKHVRSGLKYLNEIGWISTFKISTGERIVFNERAFEEYFKTGD